MKMVKKFLSMLLAVMMIVSVMPIASIEAEAISYSGSSSYMSGKYYTQLCNVQLTGDGATDIVNVAKSQIGYKSGSSNSDLSGSTTSTSNVKYSEYGRVIGSNPNDWCAYFVSWCARQAGISSSVLPNFAGCTTAYNTTLPNAGCTMHRRTTGYVPVKGDIIFFGTSSSYIYHVGIVTNVTNSTVYYIDGNNVTTTPHCVASSSKSLTYSEIWGYATPNYTDATHQVDSNYGKNFTAYPKAKITASNIFDANHNQISSTAWIGTSDKCTIHEVYTDGCCKVSYPLDGGGTKTVYSKISLFITHTHSYTAKVTKAATCTSNGVKTYTCSCGKSYTESIKALGHDYSGQRVYQGEHPHEISQRCVRYSSCGGYVWTGENAVIESCSSCRAENPKKIYASTSSVGLMLGGTESTTVYAWTGGIHNNPCVLNWQTSNSNVSCSWGEWNDAGKLPLTITAKAPGTTVVTLSVKDKNTDSVLHSVKITVHVGAKAYEVSYNANGGTGAPSSQTKIHGTNLKLSSAKPTRTGYTFLGWSTSSTATLVMYCAGDDFSKNEDTPLYAVWQANTYTVKYNANGGSGSMSNSSHTYDVSKALTSNAFTREGYKFLGWSTSSAATTPTYTDKQSVKNLTSTNGGTVTLYAVWKANTYTINYNANGGIGSTSSSTHTYDAAKALTSNGFTKNGYTFLGWSTSATATIPTYTDGQSVKNLTSANGGAITLYAVWKQNTTALTVNSSNSAVISNAGESKYFTYTPTASRTYVIYSTSDTDTRVYLYNSSGTLLASDDDSGIGNNFRLQYNMTAGTTYRFEIKYYSSSKTGTIPFKFGNVFTVTYNANGGTGEPSSQYIDYGATLTLSTTKPTRTGYTFLGWSTSSTATSVTYSAGSSFTTNANTTLYAVWKPNTYTIKFNANGGTGTMGDQTHTYGSAQALSANKFTKHGYTFVGWSTSQTATTAIYTDKQSVQNLTSTNGGTVTLYAVWKANTYTIKYNANGGTGTMSNQTHTYGSAQALSANKFTKHGYTFVGWSTSQTATTAIYTDKQSVQNLTSTNSDIVTLYAVWKANTYTVSYDANGGTDSPSSQIKTYGEDLTLSYEQPTREGYDFVGWSTNPSATSATYSAGSSFTTDANTTLYAIWKKAGHDINNDGVVNSSDIGLLKLEGIWYYVKDGEIDYTFTGLVKHTNGIWYYVENGILDWSYSGLWKHNGTWYYVQKGQINWKFTGLVKHTNGTWYYVQGAKLNWGYTGLVKHNTGSWFYVQKGQINFDYTGLVKHTNGTWYYVQNGKLNWNKTGLVKHTDGNWYYVQKGQINWKYTGLVKHTNGKWYYVQKGKLNWKYTGYTYYNGKKYKVVNGEKV